MGQHPLVDEHAVLLHEVGSRAGAVRVGVDNGRWPDDEVAAIVDFLRYEVIDQAVTTERLLFPLVTEGLGNSDIGQPVADHVHLRDLTDQLANVATGNGNPPQRDALVELLGALDDFLVRHMHAEEALPSPTTSAGVESLRQSFRCHLWFPLTEGPEIDVDTLPREFALPGGAGTDLPASTGERILVRAAANWTVCGTRCRAGGPAIMGGHISRKVRNNGGRGNPSSTRVTGSRSVHRHIGRSTPDGGVCPIWRVP